jgi:hypothetical protein
VSDLVELIQKTSISKLREKTGEALTSVEKQIVDETDGFLALREQQGDHDRLEIVNPRLLNNLRKAFRIASIEAEKIDSLNYGMTGRQF